LGGIIADAVADVSCEATVDASAYAVYDFAGSITVDATVTCDGHRLGDNWNDVSDVDNTWTDVSTQSNTWTLVSANSNTWTDDSTSSNTWTDQSVSSNTWLRQG
jgi:hypothetical protein